jgi:xanthosine utilization system XapX-like protein
MLFFLGVVCGIAIVILYALYLAARKPKEAPATPTCNVIGLGGSSVTDLDAAWVKRILTQIDRQTLTEISKVQ